MVADITGKLLALAALVVTATAQLCPCPKNYYPMCGSDGTTYGNKCTFRCARASNPILTLRHEGACRFKRSVAKNELCPCTRELRFVCGSDGVTYSNPCLLKCAAKSNPDLKETRSGPCPEEREQKKSPCACQKNYRPVCGSDGTTYGNKCTFHCAQNTNPDLSLSYKGKCVDASRLKRAVKEGLCPCTKERLLVCGTNGRTYGNPCMLKCAAKSTPGLETAHMGPCLETSRKTY